MCCHAYIVGFRATQMFQDKAQFAGNGMSFSRTATPYWSIWVAPYGRAVKQSSAVLHLLVRARHYRRRRAFGNCSLRCSTSCMAQASLSIGSRSHLLPAVVLPRATAFRGHFNAFGIVAPPSLPALRRKAAALNGIVGRASG